MAESKRFVRNRTGQPVYLYGHGVVPPGEDGVEVVDSDAVAEAFEAKVLEEATRPKGRKTNEEGGS